MRKVIVAAWLLLALLSSARAAQDSPAPKAEVRVCVANVLTEIKQATDTIALRDRLAAYLRNGSLVKDAKAEILVLQEDSDAKTAPELRELKCDFAIYTRALAARLNGTKRPDTDRTVVARTVPQQLVLVPGLQFTVVRVSSGIPVHIDRIFLSHPYEKEEDMWLLLRNEQERIEAQLLRRIMPPPAVSK